MLYKEYLCNINKFICDKEFGIRNDASFSFDTISDTINIALNSFDDNKIITTFL